MVTVSIKGVKNMPRGDGTGPMGYGSMTGRGAGYCAGFRLPGFLNTIGRRGLTNRGRGYGRMLCMTGLLSGCALFAYGWSRRKGR
jgi:hypothetical protein